MANQQPNCVSNTVVMIGRTLNSHMHILSIDCYVVLFATNQIQLCIIVVQWAMIGQHMKGDKLHTDTKRRTFLGMVNNHCFKMIQ